MFLITTGYMCVATPKTIDYYTQPKVYGRAN